MASRALRGLFELKSFRYLSAFISRQGVWPDDDWPDDSPTDLSEAIRSFFIVVR